MITDRDGVPVVSVADDTTPELAMRASFLSTFGMATDQGSKLGLGKNKTIICMYSSYQVTKIYMLLLLLLFNKFKNNIYVNTNINLISYLFCR